jgi:hypothetical protein
VTRLLLPLLLACRPGETDLGTSVGNPGQTSMSVAPTDGLAVRAGTLPAEELVTISCEGERKTTPIGRTLLLNGTDQIEVPPGTWCGVELRLNGNLRLDGIGDSGGPMSLELELASVQLSSPGLSVDGQALVLELGSPGWLDRLVPALEGGSSVGIGPTDPEHDALAAAVADGSGLYEDANASGQVEDEERGPGAEAEGEDHEDEGEDEGEEGDTGDESEDEGEGSDGSDGAEQAEDPPSDEGSSDRRR